MAEMHFEQVMENLCTFGKVDRTLLRNIANTYFSDEEFEIIPLLNRHLADYLTM